MRAGIRVGLAGAVAAASAAVAIPALTSAQSPGGRQIVARDKVLAVTFQHARRSTRGDRLAFGDRVLTRQATFDAQNHRSGTLTTDCVNVGPAARVFGATLQCVSAYRFADGEVISMGAAKLTNQNARFAIVGGTGAYHAASGEVGAGPPARGYDTVDALHLDR